MTKEYLIGILLIAKRRSMGCFQVAGLLIYYKQVFWGGIFPEFPKSRKLLCWSYYSSCSWESFVLICSTCLSMATVPQRRTGLPLLLYHLWSTIQSPSCSRVVLKEAPVTLSAAVSFSSEVATSSSSEIQVPDNKTPCVSASQFMIADMIVVLIPSFFLPFFF